MSENEPISMPEGPPAPLEYGDVVADKYRVEALLGEGAMGCVFAAEHTQLGHKVALKVLRVGALAHKEAVERFLREGRAVARLQSEHIARVTDVGTLRSGVPYLVMEFLEGTDLAHILKTRRGTLAVEEAVDLVLQTCEALAHAHARGIVHRDLKPANLFVTTQADGSAHIKVLDFGISKYNANSMGAESVNEITMTAALMGTPKYMSPEQIHDSRAVDNRADIWALGTVTYEILTGARPFVGSTVAMTCVKILQEEPADPRSLRPEIPPGLEEVILRCLRKDPNDRYANVGELAEALAPFGPPNSPAVALKIVRIVQNPPELKNTGMRGNLASTGQFSGMNTPSSRIATTPSPGASAILRSSTISSPSSPSSSSSSAARPHVASDAGGDTLEADRQKKKRGAILLALGAVLAVIVVVLFATRSSNDAASHAGAEATKAVPMPSAVAPPVSAVPPVGSQAFSAHPIASASIATAPSALPTPKVEPPPTRYIPRPAARGVTAVAASATAAISPTPAPTPAPTPVPTAPTPPPKPASGPESVLDDRH